MEKFFINFIQECVAISGNQDFDKVVFMIIATISFLVAFNVVGTICEIFGVYGAAFMGQMHWTIRLLVFLGLTYVAIKIAQCIAWLCSFPWWVYLLIGITLVAFIVLRIIHLKRKRPKNATQ